ncbi:MAG: LysM peptidoglycan-binding domain-containing protein [Sandaracinaceae bacterium]|nr:LysM peptidoglycan-binding domain-containing protein [Sandaracinaceae bacterium]
MRVLLALVALGAVAPVGAAAQGSGDRDALVPGEESEELRELRLAEEQLFGGQPLARIEVPVDAVRVSDAPAAGTSDAPAPAPERAAGRSRDLSWMQGLTLPDIPVRWDDRVIEYLEYFSQDARGRRFIAAWLRRVDRYGPMIRRVLREQGLPRDLIFVAMVESGFDPYAHSNAGAAGMWQFVRGTGEELGLTVNHWVDMRLDPRASTGAAGRYLRMLHERFGTWELAFAAYNMGYGALLRAIRKYNTNDYWELSHLEAGLPFETNLYVAKIVACAIVAQNRERFGFGDLELEAPVDWETVEVPGGVSLTLVARAAGTDLATIRQLNPALRRGRVPPGRESRRVSVPAGSSAGFAERWARIQPRSPVHLPHVVRFGETLGDIARERGVTEASLRELNEIEAGQDIGAGMVLLAPVTAASTRARGDAPAERPVVSLQPGPSSVEGRRRIFYRVVGQDRIETIARFFRVRVDDIRTWNAIDPDARLQSGMYLQLFVAPSLDLSRALVLTPDEARVLVVGTEEFFAYHEGQSGRLRFRYVVQAGDTLTAIGRRFGIATSSLARINQFSRSQTLHPGDELIIYAERERVPAALRAEAEAVAEPASEPEAAAEPAPAAAPEPAPGAAPAAAPASEPAPAAAAPGADVPASVVADARPAPAADEVPQPDDLDEQH